MTLPLVLILIALGIAWVQAASVSHEVTLRWLRLGTHGHTKLNGTGRLEGGTQSAGSAGAPAARRFYEFGSRLSSSTSGL